TANLFTIFGEPDVRIGRTGAGVVVELLGVDVYDPTTGIIRSNDISEIALWRQVVAHRNLFSHQPWPETGSNRGPYPRRATTRLQVTAPDGSR
ncbi:MAG: hypothetical protein ACRDT0_00020, partial [Pseudonocardiaceae bacterium]